MLEENVKDEDEEGRQTHDFEVTRDEGTTTIGERINENINQLTGIPNSNN